MAKKIEELIIEDELQNGVFAISFVSQPAMEEDFVYMSKDSKDKMTFAKASEEKHMVYAPAIIPDKQIKRYNDNGDEYYIYFSEETTTKLAQNYLKNHFQDSFTFQHAEQQEGASVVESWIVADGDNDKAKKVGFSVPKGTWMVGVHIDSIELWEKIKTGKVKGLSIEAFMASQIIENSITDEEKIIKELEEILNKNI